MTTVYCGDFTAVTATRFGKLYLDTRDTSLAPHIMLDGSWEPWVTPTLLGLLATYPGAIFIDVGANVGWYTLIACAKCSMVYSFEPQERMVSLLRRSLSANGFLDKCKLRQTALGDRNGRLALAADPFHAGGAHLSESPAQASALVSITRLDDVIPPPDRGGSPDVPPMLLKIDVEGWEPAVIRGAKNVIGWYHPIILMEHQPGGDYDAMYASLAAQSYTFRHIRNTGYPSAALTLEELSLLPPTAMVLGEYVP